MVDLRGKHQKLGTICTGLSEVRVSPVLGSLSIIPVSSVTSDPGLWGSGCALPLISVGPLRPELCLYSLFKILVSHFAWWS